MYLLLLLGIATSLQLKDEWLDVGCTNSGLLAPELHHEAWKHANHDILHLIAESDHPLATRACTGEAADPEPSSQHFHLMWECFDAVRQCLLPSLNVKTLSTLLRQHPSSKVTIWSNTLSSRLLSKRLPTGGWAIRTYEEELFEDLPAPARQASHDIPSFFQSKVESHSHWSDLVRLAVLWKYGGIWADFDSLWVAPVTALSDAPEWIPFTSRSVSFSAPLDDKEGFLEGGIMKFADPQSSFVTHALQNFPEYTPDVADTWARVGPQLLTETYQQLAKTSEPLPSLVDSTLLYGSTRYRENLDAMHTHMDADMLADAIQSNNVAFHLFTSSGERQVSIGSMVDFLFQAAGVEDTGPGSVPLGSLSRRRRATEGSDTYDTTEPPSPATTETPTTEYPTTTTEAPSPQETPKPTEATVEPTSKPTISEPTSNPTFLPSLATPEPTEKERETDTPTIQPTESSPEPTISNPKLLEWKFEGDFSTVVTDREGFLSECSAKYPSVCSDVRSGSIIVTFAGSDEEIEDTRNMIQADGEMDLDSFSSVASIGEETTPEPTTTSPTTPLPTAGDVALVAEEEDEGFGGLLLYVLALVVLFLICAICCMAFYMCCRKDDDIKEYTPNHLELYAMDSDFEPTRGASSTGYSGEAGSSRIPYSGNNRTRAETTELEQWDYTKRSVQASYQREQYDSNPLYDQGGDVLAEDNQDANHSYVDHRVVTL